MDLEFGPGYQEFQISKYSRSFLGGASYKESTYQCRRCGFDPWVGKIPWGGKWQPTSVFLPGESPGQRSLVGRSPQGRKELDTTERAHTHTCTRTILKYKFENFDVLLFPSQILSKTS